MHRLTHKHIDFSKMFHHVPAGCTRNTKRLQLDELDDHALLSCCHNLTWFYSNQREILLTCTAIAYWNNFQQFFSSKHHWTGFHPNPFHCSMDWTIKIEGVREYFLCLALWTLWLARIDATSRSRRWMVRGLTMRWLVFFLMLSYQSHCKNSPKQCHFAARQRWFELLSLDVLFEFIYWKSSYNICVAIKLIIIQVSETEREREWRRAEAESTRFVSLCIWLKVVLHISAAFRCNFRSKWGMCNWWCWYRPTQSM